MLTVFVKITAKPGCETALHEGVRKLVAATQTEPGSIVYEAYASANEPAVVRFFEVWQDAAARDAHRTLPHFLEFFELSRGLLGAPPEIDEVRAL